MKRVIIKCITFLRCYQSLIIWGICAGLLLMTFFQKRLPGESNWIVLLLVAGVFLDFYFSSKNRKNYPLPEKIKTFVVTVLIISFIFAYLNFFLYLAKSEGSFPEIVDGAYALVNYDGKGTKFITEMEYDYQRCIEQRFWCANMMVLYTIAMLAHLKQKEEQADLKEQEQEEPKFNFIMQSGSNPLLPKRSKKKR